MRRSSLLATLSLVLVVFGTPLLVVSRLLDGVLPVRSLDFLIAIFVVGWVQVGLALLRRNDALEALTQPRFSLRWQADNLVAQSMLGAGLPARPLMQEDGLVQVSRPADSVAEMLPPAVKPVDRVPTTADDEAPPRRIVPSLASQPDSDGPEVLATEEYVVARGDTFWSISEYVFGDGRHWKTVQKLNLGREVAPGIVLTESHEPRIGWSIVIPLVESPSETGQPAISDQSG